LQPPELNPVAFPELLLQPGSALDQLDAEIRAEFLILNNLDAALQNKPKPIMFKPTAGG
jgi:hypothetical protein